MSAGSFSKYASTGCSTYKYSFPIYNMGGRL